MFYATLVTRNDENQELYEILIELENIRNLIVEFGDQIFKDGNIYGVEFLENVKIADWMYSSESSFKGERKMLIKLIDQANTVFSSEYEEIKKEINELICTKPQAFISMFATSDSDLHVRNIHGWEKSHRFYLKNIRTPDEFMDAAKYCFPNLYFHSNIKNSLKTLSTPLHKYISEISFHLSVLNDSFGILFQENRCKGLAEVLSIFKSMHQIASSLEGDSKSAKKRFTFSFTAHDGSVVDLVCEPHTKLSKSGDTKFRFD
ncbi:MAG: hypothetical protein KAX49_02460 [Halanaerobiales bacterium]|nr:hypothetical protein [Halanaerobiales bacterium]